MTTGDNLTNENWTVSLLVRLYTLNWNGMTHLNLKLLFPVTPGSIES